MIEDCVTSTSAVSEPRTAATATTAFPRFSNGTALATYGPSGRRGRDCRDIYVSIGKKNKDENARQSVFSRAIACY